MSFYNTAPLPQDLFTRVMADKFHKTNKVRRNMAFMSFFGIEANGSQSRFTDDALSVDIEIIKDNTSISALSTRGVAAGLNDTTTQGSKATYTSRVFPIAKDTGAITAVETYQRRPGENAFGGKSQYERMREIAASIFDSKIRAQLWLLEQLASQSILTGKMAVNAAGDEFDFRRDADNAVVAANPWTDTTNGTPLEDVDLLCTRVDRNGHSEPDMVLMDVKSYSAFIRHPDVTGIADNRRYDLIWVGENSKSKPDSKYDRHIKAGWMPRAYLTTESGYSVWIFTTNEWYRNDAGDKVDFMPEGTVTAISSEARFDRYFGPHDKLPSQVSTNSVIEQVFGLENVMVDAMSEGGSSIVDPRQFHFFAFGTQDNSAISLEVQTAPIYACTQVDAVATMTSTIV